MDAVARDAAAWLRAASEDVERGRMPLDALPAALRAFADSVEAETGPPVAVDYGPGIGGVTRPGWER